MQNALRVLSCAALVGLGGCASIIKGTSQTVGIDTSPQGAACTVTREGAQLAKIDSTPGKLELSRSKNALVVSCVKPPEYPTPTVQTVESQFNGVTAGNILLGGIVGIAIDASTGANNTYPEQVTVTLVPPSGAPMPAPSAAPSSSPAASSAPATTMQPVADEPTTTKPKKPKTPKAPAAPATPDAPKPPGN